MTNLSYLTAVILAGGQGTRLAPVVNDRPKSLALVNGRPFITYLLDQLAAVEIRRAVICVGHLADMVIRTLGDRYRHIELVYSRESQPLGTGGALRNALPSVSADPVLVFNGDSYIHASLAAFHLMHLRRRAHASLLVTEVPDGSRYGSVLLDNDDRITGFCEKKNVAGPVWINAGVYLLSRELIGAIPAGRSVSLESDTFRRWIGRGFYGWRCKGEFLDIGTPESFAQGQSLLPQITSRALDHESLLGFDSSMTSITVSP